MSESTATPSGCSCSCAVAHMKASWIFSTNDVLANLGVIAAGALVGLLVLNGARRILGLTA